MSGNLYNIDDYTINDIVTILDLEYPILKKTIFDVIDKNIDFFNFRSRISNS